MTVATPVVALVGALDTKAAEYGFVRDRLRAAGIGAVLVDTGVLGRAGLAADVDRSAVAAAAGTELAALAARADRGEAVRAMADGAGAVVSRLVACGEADAVLVLGGSNAGVVMRHLADALPMGLPKVLLSTIVVGDTRPYVGDADVTMCNPVVDLAGLTTMSVPVLARAVDGLVGVLTAPPVHVPAPSGGAVGGTMFGVTTACVTGVADALAARDTELHAFHANGVGGRTFERLVAERAFDAVVDLTTTELADELVGGVCSAGPDRQTAAARAGVPQVVGVGALDMVNFGAADTVPERFRDRLLLAHNEAVTLMRTDRAENAALGALLADRVNASTAAVEVVVPTRGFSQVSAPGGPFADPAADAALVDALRERLRPDVPLRLVDAAMNDPEHVDAVVAALERVRSTTTTTTERNPA